MTLCSVDWCTRPATCRGVCNSHYRRLLRYGDPEAGQSYKVPTDLPLVEYLDQVGWDETVVMPGMTTPCHEARRNPGHNGYIQIEWGGRHIYTHVAVAVDAAGLSSLPAGQVVHHRCENRACHRLSHLEMMTRSTHGSHHGSELRTILTAPQVALIRSRYAAGGVTQVELAREFGVTQPNISKIVRRQNWASQ